MATQKTQWTFIFYLTILFASIGLNLFLLNKYCIEKPIWSECRIVIPEGGEQIISSDSFLGKVTDFYQSLLNYQFVIVGVILVVGFMSSYIISTRQVRDLLDEELYSEHFKEHYLPRLEEYAKGKVIEIFNNNKVLADLAKLRTRVEAVEETINQFEINLNQPNTKLIKNKKPVNKTVKRKGVSDGNDSKGNNRIPEE